MIKAEIYYDEDGIFIGFKVQDHSKPIVCAAVSALVFSTLNGIMTHTSQDVNICVGNNCVEFAVVGERNRDAGLLLDVLLEGLEQISIEYPDAIRVVKINGNNNGTNEQQGIPQAV